MSGRDGVEQTSSPAGATADDSGLLPVSPPLLTRTPGLSLLETPSKRAARARLLIAGSTTPTGTPTQSRPSINLPSTPGTTTRQLFGRSIAVRRSSYLAEQVLAQDVDGSEEISGQ